MYPKIDKTILILLLGGSGTRFNSPVPKQYIQLPHHSHALFLETLINLSRFIKIDSAILVGNPEYMTRSEFLDPLESFQENNPGIELHITSGGKTRHESFQNGAELIRNHYSSGVVMVHDANRPYIDSSFGLQINEAIKNTNREKPCWIPVTPSTDSLCESDNGEVMSYVPRSKVHKIQTPQVLYLASMLSALSSKMDNAKPDFTDEGSFMLEMGEKVFTFPGSISNIKITYPEDIS